MGMAKNDIKFMEIALAEAQKGLGRTSPNPCVGAVITQDNNIIAKGYHKKAGSPHAEINALNEAGDKAHGATMYVTLEPCSHTGRTGPCCEAVVKAGISRVVIGMLDPNPRVDGGGKKFLLDNNVQVSTGVLEEQCKHLNLPFFKYITTGRPLVLLKAGVSLDGRLNYLKGTSGWITGEESGKKVHQLRDQFDAILVGRNTVDSDNPSLTTRLSNGVGKDPHRIILDSELRTKTSAKIFSLNSLAKTIFFCHNGAQKHKIQEYEDLGVEVIVVDVNKLTNQLNLEQILRELGKRDIISLLVEGGPSIHSSFLRERLADRVCLFYAPLFAGSEGDALTTNLQSSSKTDSIRIASPQYTRIGDDFMLEGEIHYPE